MTTPSSKKLTARPSGPSDGHANRQANDNDKSPPSPNPVVATPRQQAIPRDLVSKLKASRASLKEAALRLMENKTDSNPNDPSYDLLRACAMLSGSLSATLALVDKSDKLRTDNDRLKAKNDRLKAQYDKLQAKTERLEAKNDRLAEFRQSILNLVFGEYGDEERRQAILDLIHESMAADVEVGESDGLKNSIFDSGDDEADDLKEDTGNADRGGDDEVGIDVGNEGERRPLSSSSPSSSASSLF